MFDPCMCMAQVNAEEPANKDKVVMEWSNNQLLRLEESLAAMEKQIGSTHPHVSALSLATLSTVSAAFLLSERKSDGKACIAGSQSLQPQLLIAIAVSAPGHIVLD